MKFQKLINLYIDHLERNEYSKRTVESYINNLKKFFVFIDKYYSRIEKISQITKKVILDYYDYLKESQDEKRKSISIKTISHRLVVLKSFFKFLYFDDYIINNPAMNIRLPRTENNLNNKVLPEEDIFKIIESIKPVSPENIRDRSIIELFYSTGIRTSEMAEIKTFDIDLKQQVLTVVKGKGAKTRIVPIGMHAIYYLDLYLNKSRKYFLGNNNSDYLFLNNRSTPFNRQTLNKLMNRLTKNLGLKIKVTCYTYRHSIATHLIQNKVDIRFVQELLGHESIKTTQRYCHLTITDLKKVHALYHPRESLSTSSQQSNQNLKAEK
ncbi:MAG: tyrosine-type recombinase/integrase [Spirochaetes bacterium]|nr:tyrosine-type recombinase/integrase [Spirochaetota bacterium]